MLSFTWNIFSPQFTNILYRFGFKGNPTALVASFFVSNLISSICLLQSMWKRSHKLPTLFHHTQRKYYFSNKATGIRSDLCRIFLFVLNFYLGLLKPTGFDWLNNDYTYSNPGRYIFGKSLCQRNSPFSTAGTFSIYLGFWQTSAHFQWKYLGKWSPHPQTSSFADYDF